MADIIASSEGRKETIQMGSRISLHFALLMPGGEEIDTTRRSKPASLTLGDGNLLPGFEEALIGQPPAMTLSLSFPLIKPLVSEQRPMSDCWLAPFAELGGEEPGAGLVVSFHTRRRAARRGEGCLRRYCAWISIIR